MVSHRTRACALGLCLAVSAAPAPAKEHYGSWHLGPLSTLTPSVSLEGIYDTNVFRTDAETETSMRWIQKPALVFRSTLGEAFKFGIDYGAALGQYSHDGRDDYADQLGKISAGFDGAIVDLGIEASRERGHDDRGTGPTNGFALSAFEGGAVAEPTEYRIGTGRFAMGIGEEEARFRLDLDVERSAKSYQNLESLTRQRDHQRTRERAQLFVNLQQRIDLVIETRFEQIDYDIAQTSGTLTGVKLDSDVNTFLIGARWGGEGAATGSVKLGAQSRSFDRLDDTNSFVWEADLAWRLTPAASVALGTSSGSRETDNAGSAIDFWRYDVDLELGFRERMGVDLGIGYLQEEFNDAAPSREDDIFEARFTWNVALRDFATWHLGYRYSTRDGTLPDTNFARSELFLRLELGLP